MIPLDPAAKPLPPAGEETLPAAPAGLTLPEPSAASHAPPPMPSSLAHRPNVQALLVALQRRWLLATTLGLLAAAGAATVAWLLAPKATFTARAKVHLTRPATAGSRFEQMVDFPSFQRTQIAVVKSQLVLNAALKREKVKDLSLIRKQLDPVTWLAEELAVDFEEGPQILRISLDGEDPQELVLLVNAVMDAYLEEFANREQSQRRALRVQLTDKLNHHRKELEDKHKQLRALAPDQGGGDPKVAAELARLPIENLREAHNRRFALQARLGELEVTLNGLEQSRKRAADGPLSKALVDQRIEEDPLVKEYLRAVRQVEVEMDLIKRVGTRAGGEKKLAQLGNELVSLHGSLTGRRAKLRGEKEREIREEKLLGFDRDIAKAGDEIIQVKAQIQGWTDKIERLVGKLQQGNVDNLEMLLAQAEVAREQQRHDTILAELDLLDRIDPKAQNQATALDRAFASSTNNRTKKFMLAGGSAGGALALVLLGVAYWEFRSRRIYSVDEVVCGLGVRFVGTLPSVSGRRRLAGGADYADRHNLLTEAVDSYRTILLHAARSGSIRVLMVSSAMPGEGKTSLASHLAVSVARSGRKVLLLDCDLRNPAAHRLFDLPRGPGVCEYLRGEAGLADVVRPTAVPGLSMLTAGKGDEAAVQALARPGVHDLFEQLRPQFEFIVVDSSPVLPVADSLLVAQHVDGVVFSILRDVSRMPKVCAAYHRLLLLGVHILGAVVTGADESDYGGYGYSMPYAHTPPAQQ